MDKQTNKTEKRLAHILVHLIYNKSRNAGEKLPFQQMLLGKLDI